MFFSFLTQILIAALLSAALFFHSTNAQTPNPRQILDRGVMAMGGKDKLKAITSRQVFASVKRLEDGAIGKYEFVSQYPSQFYYRLTINNEFEQAGFNGITGYGVTSASELKTFNEEAAKLIYAEAIYRNGYWFHDEQQRMSGGMKALLAVMTGGISLFAKVDSVKFEGEDKTDGRTLQGVRFDLRDFNTDIRAYFDGANGRLAREELSFGSLLEIYSYDDFRSINGILEPHLIRMKRGNDEYEISVEKIAFNELIPITKFDLPSPKQQTFPALPELLAQARANQAKILQNYDQFTYERSFKFTDSYCTEDSNGQQDCTYFDRQQLFDVMFHRSHPMVIIKADDRQDINARFMRKSLDPIEARQKRIDDARNKINSSYKTNPQQAEREGMKRLDGSWGRDIMAVLQYAQFGNLRAVKREGRDCYALDFMPAAERDYGEDNFVKQAAGTIFIDAQTKYVVYLLVHETTKFLNGRAPVPTYTKATRLQFPVCDGLWLPTEANGALRATFFRGDWFNRITYGRYKINGQLLQCTPSTGWPK